MTSPFGEARAPEVSCDTSNQCAKRRAPTSDNPPTRELSVAEKFHGSACLATFCLNENMRRDTMIGRNVACILGEPKLRIGHFLIQRRKKTYIPGRVRVCI